MPLIAATESLSENVVHFVKTLRKAGVATLSDLRSLADRDPEKVHLLQTMLVDLYR